MARDNASRGELQAARKEADRLRAENERLRALLGMPDPSQVAEPASAYALFSLAAPLPALDDSSPLQEKVRLMRALFRAREDVHAIRWTNARTGKTGYAPAVAGGWHGSKKSPKDYLALSDNVIEEHLCGRQTIGIYPLLDEDTSCFLACDFDGKGWALDALAFLAVCRRHSVPAYLERSRSGEGAHIWVVFTEPVKASVARRLGAGLLGETMIERAEVDLESFDRLFPSQDFVPKGSFGNLIALPLQGQSRAAGCTEFLDPSSLEPFPDQWAFLSQVQRLTPAEVHDAANAVRPVDVGPRSAPVAHGPVQGQPPAPAAIDCVVGAMVSVERSGLPPALVSAIKHLATLHNPEFYKRQKLRFSTFQTPRFIRCYDEDLTHVHLPRGILEELRAVAGRFGSGLSLADRRSVPPAIPLEFTGKLDPTQKKAVAEVLAHDQGILVAPPGTGKTVMACAMVAARKLPTLVLVHREPLLDQWHARLAEGLGLPGEGIGVLGRGKDKRTGVIDVAMIQSLRPVEDLEGFFSRYGFLVIDECHHVPAVSFEACVKRAPLRFILGLTATPYRRDGLEELITMHCGPIRHEVDGGNNQGAGMQLVLHAQHTRLALERSEELPIQDIFRGVVDSEQRNRLIERDVLRALADRRRCLVLSEWKEHVGVLADLLRSEGVEPIVLEGGMGKKRRESLLKRIVEVGPDEDLVIVSTGQYIGEGFDCPQLDSLFLAFPASFRGKLVQYTGRILRTHVNKPNAVVYDYVDSGVPVLKAMFIKRLRIYRSLGFEEQPVPDVTTPDGADMAGEDCQIEFDGYWLHLSARGRPPYELMGKYLFFSEDKGRLIEIARNEILHHGFHRAKVNAELLGRNLEHVLCLYYHDDSRKDELADRNHSDYQVKFRYWKSDADTRDGKYSDAFLQKLDPSTRAHFTDAPPPQEDHDS
ncbi:MAG: DEAD/DEAH box helicase family protein [Acidobacteria bacterium]|nr:DEAD/DEAH box helicase family protein [Acidobacteriota bacterium]